MEKIFESKLNGFDESADKIHVYAFENETEYEDYNNMTHYERLEAFDFGEESFVNPGAIFHRYSFDISCNHAIVTETVALNVWVNRVIYWKYWEEDYMHSREFLDNYIVAEIAKDFPDILPDKTR